MTEQRNNGSRLYSIQYFMLMREFALGIVDAAMDEPFDPGYETWKHNNQLAYERGRQFSIVCKGIELKIHNKVTRAASAAYMGAKRRGEIL